MITSDSTKVCSKCNLELPLSEYRKQGDCRLGRRPDCKSCVKKWRRGYYSSRQEEARTYSKNYYHANRQQAIQTVKQYAARNKDRISQYHADWYAANRALLIEKKRQDYWSNRELYNQLNRKSWHKNKTKRAAYRKEYERAHPDLVRFHKMQHEARKRNAKGSCTSEQWRQKCGYHGWGCIYCGKALTPKSVTIEHRKPLSKGGSNWPANLGPCCRACNQSKNNKTEREFRLFLKRGTNQICFQKLKVVSAAARDVIA